MATNADAGAKPGSPTTARRAGRPRRLTIETVVKEAIRHADEQGLTELTMPRLARRLGVGTMTLYGYVANKQELLDHMASALFADLEVPDAGDDWRRQVSGYFRGFRKAALAHPSLAGLLANGRVTIPAVFDHLETLLGAMRTGGLGTEDAVRLFYSSLCFTIGEVQWEVPRTHAQSPAAYAQQWHDLLAALDPRAYPLLTGPAAAHLGTVSSDEQFEWGLWHIIAAAGPADNSRR
jgi:AcrR family transcriptional regulator